MPEVITVGEILVEIMRKEVDIPLNEPADFVGPFPSGAPAIFIDCVERLGVSGGIIGAVGGDDFGDMVLSRLEGDGVDVSRVRVLDDEFSGTAFVTYFSDGSRKFIFHVGKSACGEIGVNNVSEEYVKGASAVHISGASLTLSEGMKKACYEAVEIADENDILVSFDPNVRKESVTGNVRDITDPVLRKTNLLVSGGEELEAVTGSESEKEGVEKALGSENIEVVAVKKAEEGCSIYTGKEKVEASGFDVEEVDPTGAGDAFSGGFLVGWMENMELERLAKFANAVGAKAVTEKGPMEGLGWRDEVEEILS